MSRPSEVWAALPRRKQLRVIHAMQNATVHAWRLQNIHVERMINGALEVLDRFQPDGPLRTHRRRHRRAAD